ncbi:sterol desaturase family protein [Coralliovum pocilloporae]|uniref:sterol desaturase family protein n=1 Tax=Coralliovum pocilloporae TaxID=3066369 RepID=UPI003306F5D2
MALLELWLPRRVLIASKPRRWITNWLMLAVDGTVLRVVFPAAAVGIAAWASDLGFGLFHWLPLPLWVAGIISFLVLDFAVWLWHVISHHVPFLWRFHKVHHTDRDLDVTSAVRFHPGEILLSMVWKSTFILLLGAPVEAVLLFEIILNGGAMFNHANVHLPKTLDNVLRLLIVTPDMHRVHHSVRMTETNSNYGFNLSIWDRWFQTYIPEPEGGQTGMTIGLEMHQDDGPTQILWSLLLPFRTSRRPSP